jgi:protein phosphatase
MNTSRATIESYGISDIGLSRKTNEDVFAELPHHGFYVLADGIGGHQAGEVAAKEAVFELCDLIDVLFAEDRSSLSLDYVVTALKRAFVHTNEWVHTLSTKHPELGGMGTTLSCVLFFHDHCIYAHVGDSRIYRFRSHLEQLTSDHSIAEDLMKEGDLDRQTAALFKHVLTRAIGMTPTITPDVGVIPLQPGDLFLLCSDGLTDALTDAEIETALKTEKRLKEAAFSLVDLAKEKKGSDNITLLLLRT